MLPCFYRKLTALAVLKRRHHLGDPVNNFLRQRLYIRFSLRYNLRDALI
jgi:hypothetical protein